MDGENVGPATGLRTGRSSRIYRRLVVLPLFAALGVAAWWLLTWEVSAGPAAGTTLHGEFPLIPARSVIRVATFNIHGARGLDGSTDLDRIAGRLEDLDLDVIGLNEVHRKWRTGNQTERLANRLQMQWLFAPTERRWSGEHFGSALLSRVSVTDWQRVSLPRRLGRGYRNYLLSEVPLQRDTQPNSQLRVIVTHIDNKGDRHEQLQTVLDLFRTSPKPVVLLGDLNSTADDPLLQELLANPEVLDCIAAAAPHNPRGRIDWILARGVTCRSAGVSQTIASDHPRLWAELEFR